MNERTENITIGKFIREARLRRRLVVKGEKRTMTAEDLAVRVNVSRSRIYQWEAADHIPPKNFRALASALRVSRKSLEEANAGFRRIEETEDGFRGVEAA